ncbi:MAG TPA: MOSC domain-containing protein [Gemmatimonadales bacterium]|jgi:MOSC domain-containing protein YiiM
MIEAQIAAVFIGRPRDLPADPTFGRWGRACRTSIHREPVSAPVRVGFLGLEGDRVADPRYHGGPDKALLAYGASHYPVWRERLGVEEMGPGGFGENLAVEGLDESAVRVGDVWSVGTAVLQVSEPRAPCWKLARRWKLKELPKLVQETGWGGWYLRVLREGEVASGDQIQRVQRDPAGPTILEAARA